MTATISRVKGWGWNSQQVSTMRCGRGEWVVGMATVGNEQVRYEVDSKREETVWQIDRRLVDRVTSIQVCRP